MDSFKFALPYRYKFIIFFVILIITTLFAFLGVSVRSFEKDKTSYVFDYILNTNQTKIGNFEAIIKDVKSSVTLFIFNNKSVDISQKIQFIAQLKSDKLHLFRGQHRVMDTLASELILQKSLLSELNSSTSLLMRFEASKDLYFLLFKSPLDKSLIITGLNRGIIDDLFENENGQFSFTHNGKEIISTLPGTNRSVETLFNLSQNKVQRLKIDKETYYAVSTPSKILNQTVVTALRESDLFSFLSDLRTQNIALAGLIISISSIIGILYAKKLTNSINLLIGAANQVSRGDYNVKFEQVEAGEIGVLQSTFVKMSEAVKFSLAREREHQRIENDLKIARLVQETFFPEYQLKNDHAHVACYYGPANECSGDWWGFFEIDHFQYYFMGDATGHGVSSALMTAKAYSLVYGLKNQMLSKEIDYLTPAKMMEALNQVLCSSKQVLMMTFFIMRIDSRTREMLYANASHEIPIIVTGAGEVQDLFEIGSMPDARLGSEMDAQYKNYTWKLNLHDIILLYTDGLTECSNSQGRYFGAKRVTLAMKKMKDLEPEKIVSGLVSEITNFSKASSFEDDVGIMVVKILN